MAILIEAIAGLKGADADRLRAEFLAAENSTIARCAALINIMESGATSQEKIDFLLAGLRDEDTNVQAVAIAESKEFASAAVLSELRGISMRPGPKRCQALIVLMRVDNQAALNICDQLLSTGDTRDLRDASVALAAVDFNESTERLSRLINEVNDPITRRHIVIALGNRGDVSVEGELENYLNTATTGQAVDIALALAIIGNVRGCNLLRRFVANENFNYPERLWWACHRQIHFDFKAADWKEKVIEWIDAKCT